MERREYAIENQNIVISFTYNKIIVDKIKELPYKFRTYYPTEKEWLLTYNEETENQIEYILENYGFKLKSSLSNQLSNESEGNIQDPSKIKINCLKTYKKEALELSSELGIITPKNYQFEDIDIMCNLDYCINGLDMGLGKTIETIFATEIMNRFPMLLLCPSNVKYQWKDLWHKVKSSREIYIYETEDKNKNWNADIIIVSLNIIGEKEFYVNKDGEEKFRVVNKIDELLNINFKYCVIDEIHFLKNSKSVRTRATHKLTKSIPAVHGLTGTLIENKPVEMVSPLIIIKMFNELFGNWNKFIYKFCGAFTDHYGFLNVKGSSNTLELNEILRSTCYFRREKREVLDDLPDIQFSILNIEITNKKQYIKAEKRFGEYIKENYSIIKQEKALNAEYLVMKNELKKLSIHGKLKGIESYLKELREHTKEKILVVGLLTAPLEKLAAKFKAKLLNGSLSSLEKKVAINDWKTNSNQFMFANALAIGTGTDGLQDNCSTMVILELPDKSGILDQTISRLERIGAKNAINIYQLLSNITVDVFQWEMIERKRKVTEGVNKGKNYEIVDIDDIIINRYLKSF